MMTRRQRRGFRTLPLLVVTISSALVGPEVGRGQESPRRSFVAVTPELRHSVSRGFKYLLRRQAKTDSFTTDKYPVAVNALVGLALLAGGHTAETGTSPEHIEALRKCTTTLLSYQDKGGYFVDGGSRMYGHGFATLFLAELYGMSPGRDEKIRKALVSAVRLIEGSQRHEGGWDYDPDPTLKAERAGSDTSITVCQTMALRAARSLGLGVDRKVIELAKRYINNAQNKDGGFRYRSGGLYFMKDSEFPRSAAGVCILYSLATLAEYKSDAIKRGIRYLEQHYKSDNRFPFYAQYYCGQAFFQVGGEKWRQYFTWVRSRLLKDQRKDGSWRSYVLQVETNPDQTTAMALIVLQLPYRFLPIHER